MTARYEPTAADKTTGPLHVRLSWQWNLWNWWVGFNWMTLRYSPFGYEHILGGHLLCLSVYVTLEQERHPGREELNTYLMEHRREPYFD